MELQFKIVTPERTVFSATVKQVTLPTAVGQITILPGHEPLIGIIEPGEICIKEKNSSGQCFLAVSDGFLEVDNNIVRVFAQTAERAEELNEQAILKAKQEAEEALKNRDKASEVAFTEAESRLRRELAKLKVVQKRKGAKPKI